MNNTIKSSIILFSATASLLIAIMSDNVLVSKICASLAIITLAAGMHLMQDKGKFNNPINK